MPNKRYKVISTTAFVRDLKKIPIEILELVMDAKNDLAINPYQGKKLTNKKVGQWRIKITKYYRLRYDIVDDTIYLYRIRHRKDVYKK